MDHRLGHRQRLRERLLHAGHEALADYEILEMLLFLNQPRGDVKPLAKELLRIFGNLNHVFVADSQELRKIKGIGDSAIATIKAVHAVALRVSREEMAQRPLMNDLPQLVRYCRLCLKDPRIEQFQVFFLDKKQQLITEEIHRLGTIDQTMVYPREIIKKAMDYGASFLLLVHNHPSGDPTPSAEDMTMTRYIIEAGQKLDIQVKDHIILGDNRYISFQEKGLL